MRDRGVSPYEVLAITFTNRAADELIERVADLVGERIVGVVAPEISRAKSDLVDFDTYRLRAEDEFQQAVAEVYREYAARLQRAGALDFDDLLAKTVELLWPFDDAREHYRARFARVAVGEWQNTNHAQYERCGCWPSSTGGCAWSSTAPTPRPA